MSDPVWSKKAVKSVESYSDNYESSGNKAEYLWGKSTKYYIHTPVTNAQSLLSAPAALLSGDPRKAINVIFDFIDVLCGGKKELITNTDNKKTIGSEKRLRLGFKIPFVKKIPLIGTTLDSIQDALFWSESSYTLGNREDFVTGDVKGTILNGYEKRIYYQEKNKKEHAKGAFKTLTKSFGVPKVKAYDGDGTTSYTIGPGSGYQFRTDKSYIVSAKEAKGEDYQGISLEAGRDAEFHLSYNDESSYAYLKADEFNSESINSIETTKNKRSISCEEMNVACKESLNLGVSRSTIRIKNDRVEISNRVDLGGPGIEVDDEERLAREEQEAAAREAAYQRIREENRLRDQILQESELGDLFKE
jgi:hypothetical protein